MTRYSFSYNTHAIHNMLLTHLLQTLLTICIFLEARPHKQEIDKDIQNKTHGEVKPADVKIPQDDEAAYHSFIQYLNQMEEKQALEEEIGGFFKSKEIIKQLLEGLAKQ